MFAILLPDFGYRLIALLHIASAVAAFGPLLLYPSLRRAGETQAMAAMHMRLAFPALVLLWVFGMGLAGLSDQVYKMSQPWLALSLVNWVVLIAVSWFLIRPAVGDASESARVRLSFGVAVTHLGLIVGLVLMIWKPGF